MSVLYRVLHRGDTRTKYISSWSTTSEFKWPENEPFLDRVRGIPQYVVYECSCTHQERAGMILPYRQQNRFSFSFFSLSLFLSSQTARVLLSAICWTSRGPGSRPFKPPVRSSAIASHNRFPHPHRSSALCVKFQLYTVIWYSQNLGAPFARRLRQ